MSVSVCLFVCLSVCLSVCPLAYRRNHMSEFYQIFSTCGRARFSSDGNALCYVLPVLWTTSRFYTMEGMEAKSAVSDCTLVCG